MTKEQAPKSLTFLDRIKRHPYAVTATFLATLIISFATLTDAIGNLTHRIGFISAEEARSELANKSIPYTVANFVASAESSDLEAVRLFLTAGMDVNALDQNDRPAIWYALLKNDRLMTERLLNAGAQVNDPSVLSMAAGQVGRKLLQQMLKQDLSKNVIDSAYVMSAQHAPPDNLALLWGRVTDKKQVASLSLTAITDNRAGCNEDDLARLRHLLASGADVNIKDSNGNFPLLNLSSSRCVAGAALLLNAGADINARCECSGWSSGGLTPLLAALNVNENEEMIEMLLKRGADVNAHRNDGNTPLHIAENQHNTRLMDLFVKHGADVNASDENATTPLMQVSSIDKAQLLIESGAKINLQNRWGSTALLLAARDRKVDVICYLVEQGADTNLADKNGTTALMETVKRLDLAIAATQCLIAHGAVIDAKDKDGRTALMLAARQGNIEVTSALLELGAQPDQKDKFGRTASDLAHLFLASEDQRDDKDKIIRLINKKTSDNLQRPAGTR